MTEPRSEVSYAAAGVDIDAGDRAVELMRAQVKRTGRPEVLGGLGGFAGLFQLDLSRYPQPVLATSTDGVGTKIAIARALDRHDTIGIDLVAMVIDDLVVVGAEPLFLTDYIATGRVVPERIAAIVAGIAEGCVQAGCALVGGETAEHPGVMAVDDYDVSGAGTGVVNADQILGPDRVRDGDVLLAMGSSGLHSNGYSLVRHVLAEAGCRLSDTPAELAGDEPGRGAAHPHPHLCPGLPAADRGRRRTRLRPHHRRRPGRQPGSGAARLPGRGRRPGQLVAGSDLPVPGWHRRHSAAGVGTNLQPGSGHGRGAGSGGRGVGPGNPRRP